MEEFLEIALAMPIPDADAVGSDFIGAELNRQPSVGERLTLEVGPN